MERPIRKKLKTVVITFTILILPLLYLLFVLIKQDEANKAYEEAIVFGDKDKDNLAIRKIDYAIRFVPWNRTLKNQKVQLLMKRKEYRKALNCILETDAYFFTALLYEYLNSDDSAKIYYRKGIPLLIEQLQDYNNDLVLLYQGERQVALFYTFLGEKEKAKKYLRKIPNTLDYYQTRIINQFDYYIESYQSGGYKDFLEGKTVFFGVDCIPKSIEIDSLIDANHFYYNGREGTGDDYQYEIKMIFEQKAVSCGMNKIDKTNE
ncbi:MAG: hypothetical protein GXO89_02275 [Chlorobi bacterium]|nr:hypothetical protein [Chlorobiota bacterium]